MKNEWKDIVDIPVKYSARHRTGRFSMGKVLALILVIGGIVIVLLSLGLGEALQRLVGG